MRKGFTLIELLVVVAIISVLAGTLLPVFAQAKSAAQRTACQSALKQVGIAWQLYADDHDATSTPSYYPSPLGEMAWDFLAGNKPGLLFPYSKEARLHQCPTFRGQSWGRQYTGYALNATYIGGDFYDGTLPASLSQVTTPAETVLFADAGFGNPVAGANYLRAPSDALFVAGKVHFRHLGRAAVLWVDGHASSPTQKFNQASYEQDLGSLSPGDEVYDLE